LLPLTDKAVRASLINASLRERNSLTLPTNFADLPWDNLDYLGWRDPRFPLVGYVVVSVEDGPVGVMLRQAEGRLRSRAQCVWCEDVQLPNDVVFFNAKRAGQAGRDGNTVSTLVCSNFECSANVRKRPPMAYVGFDVEAARLQRIDALREHVRAFVVSIRDGS
jgi:hypothetical protein